MDKKFIFGLDRVHFFINLLDIIFQASATSIREKYGSLNLLINASGILSIPNVLQPGTDIRVVKTYICFFIFFYFFIFIIYPVVF